MAALTGKKPKDTYKDLLQVSNSNAGIDGTLRFVSDGEGTDSTLKLSTTAISTTSKVVVGGDTAILDRAEGPFAVGVVAHMCGPIVRKGHPPRPADERHERTLAPKAPPLLPVQRFTGQPLELKGANTA